MFFLKTDLHIPKVTPQSSHNDPKVNQSHHHIPKVAPRCSKSEPKVTLICRNWSQSDAKKTPKSHSNAEVSPKWPQSWLQVTLICDKRSQSDPKRDPNDPTSPRDTSSKFAIDLKHDPKLTQSVINHAKLASFFQVLASHKASKRRSLEASKCWPQRDPKVAPS